MLPDTDFFAKFAFRMEESPALYLIPVNISDAPLEAVLPAEVLALLPRLHHYIVENVRTARRFLRRAHRTIDIDALTFSELNTHTDPMAVADMLAPLERGESIGLMSEAGCPAVADPGSLAVAEAQRRGFRVVPLVGPSSILMSLMGSGFNGQCFTFHGYLPIEADARARRLRELEYDTIRNGSTHIFIETPYRNNRLLQQMAETLREDTMICVAAGITDPEHESIRTMPARRWRNARYDYGKCPAIFLIGRTDTQVRKQSDSSTSGRHKR